MRDPIFKAEGVNDERVAGPPGQADSPSGRAMSMDELMRNAIQSCEHTPAHALAEHIRTKPPDRAKFRTRKEYYDALSSQLFEVLDVSKSVLLFAGVRSSGTAKHIGVSTVS